MFQRLAVSLQEVGEVIANALPFRGREDFHASPAQGVPLLLKPGETGKDRAHMQDDCLGREGKILALDARAAENEQAKVLGISRLSWNRLCANDTLARCQMEIHLRMRSQPQRA